MSTETVKVISASNPNPWEHGITFYDMVFERNGQPFPCAWGTKGGEPQPGEEITGEFSQKADGTWKFTKGSKEKPQGGSSGGGKREWKPREPRSQYDPEDMARQTRSAAQDRALKAMAMEGGTQVNKDQLRDWIKWFEDSVIEAGQAAAQAHGATESAPPPSASRGSEQPPAEEDEHRLDDALYNAGVNDFDQRRWLTQQWRCLPPERQKKCLGGLIAGDIETPPKTLRGLQEIAGPMPESFKTAEGDEVPF